MRRLSALTEMRRRIRAIAAVAVIATSVGSASAAVASDGILEYRGNGGLSGFTKFAAAAGEPLTSSTSLPTDLSPYRCVVLPVNRIAFTAAQLDSFAQYVRGGGTLVAIGEWDGFAGEANTNMNAVANRLGSGLDIVSTLIDSGFHTTGNIDSTPWTVGVSSIRYAATSAVPVVANSAARVLVRTRTTSLATSKTPFIGAEEIGAGVLVMGGDSNSFSDGSDTGYTSQSNGKLAANLCGPDVTPPKIALSSPPDGAQYLLNESVLADYGCTDAQSQVTSCQGPVASGAAIDTSSVGAKSFKVDAVSEGGQSSKTHTYSVIWESSEFGSPINGRDADGNYVLNTMKAGGAVPVKFSLNGDQGLDIFADGYPKSEQISCGSGVEVDGVEQTVSAGSSGLSYDATTDQYTYVWKTDKAWDNSCRQLVLKLADGTYHRANFSFVK